MRQEAPRPERVLVLGETDWRNVHKPFGLLREDRRRHLWIVGKTGSGKSTLLADLVRQDLMAGEGVALIDPHGDLVDAVLPWVPESRINDVLLFAPEGLTGSEATASPAIASNASVRMQRSVPVSHFNTRSSPIAPTMALLATHSGPRATLLRASRRSRRRPLRPSASRRKRLKRRP